MEFEDDEILPDMVHCDASDDENEETINKKLISIQKLNTILAFGHSLKSIMVKTDTGIKLNLVNNYSKGEDELFYDIQWNLKHF